MDIDITEQELAQMHTYRVLAGRLVEAVNRKRNQITLLGLSESGLRLAAALLVKESRFSKRKRAADRSPARRPLR